MRHLGAMAGIGGFAVAGQQVGQAAGLATAHGVRLAGEENGPHPARPILPVARCRLISALFLALPALDWLSPMHQSERKRGERPIHSAQRCRSARSMPQMSATAAGV